MPPKRQPTEPPARPRLTTSRADAQQRLAAQVAKGRDLQVRPISNQADLDQLRSDVSKWSAYNEELLSWLFDNSSMADEYRGSIGIAFGGGGFMEWVEDERRDIARDITRLEAIAGRLDLIPEPDIAEDPTATTSPNHRTEVVKSSRKVFIVHGHDNAVRDAVARFLTRLKLEPIILAEEPSRGKTIIEKLEASSSVGFAVVLLTPDDVGAAKAEAKNLKPRARQNVVLELGYFVARLGRERVCALYQSGVELPSDYHGVAYVELDAGGAWKLALAREIKAAGVDVDLNLAM